MKIDLVKKAEKGIRRLLGLFIVCLVFSGITAFPLEWEMSIFSKYVGFLPVELKEWYTKVGDGIHQTGANYPFIAYGTDWLAFSHIIIALFFLAPLKEPVKYLLIIEIGILACMLVFPLALCCGPLRGIPFFWRMIDCSFGVVGGLLLLYIRRKILLIRDLSITPVNS
jgi:hypothetical protein